MKQGSLTLIPETVYGTASGNYDGSSTTFSGDRQKAVGYYKKSSTTNSVRFICDEFVGTITLYGSLDEDPTADADWFNLYVFPQTTAVHWTEAQQSPQIILLASLANLPG